MNAGTIVALLIVAAVIGGTIFAIVRQKKKGQGACGCSGTCSFCGAKGKYNSEDDD